MSVENRPVSPQKKGRIKEFLRKRPELVLGVALMTFGLMPFITPALSAETIVPNRPESCVKVPLGEFENFDTDPNLQSKFVFTRNVDGSLDIKVDLDDTSEFKFEAGGFLDPMMTVGDLTNPQKDWTLNYDHAYWSGDPNAENGQMNFDVYIATGITTPNDITDDDLYSIAITLVTGITEVSLNDKIGMMIDNIPEPVYSADRVAFGMSYWSARNVQNSWDIGDLILTKCQENDISTPIPSSTPTSVYTPVPPSPTPIFTPTPTPNNPTPTPEITPRPIPTSMEYDISSAGCYNVFAQDITGDGTFHFEIYDINPYGYPDQYYTYASSNQEGTVHMNGVLMTVGDGGYIGYYSPQFGCIGEAGTNRIINIMFVDPANPVSSSQNTISCEEHGDGWNPELHEIKLGINADPRLVLANVNIQSSGDTGDVVEMPGGIIKCDKKPVLKATPIPLNTAEPLPTSTPEPEPSPTCVPRLPTVTPGTAMPPYPELDYHVYLLRWRNRLLSRWEK